MAVIVFNNGKRGTLPYNIAATIHQIHMGDEAVIDRATEEQLRWAKNIKEVIFDEPKKASSTSRKKGVLSTVVAEVMADESLTGRAKFSAIKQRMQERG